MLHHIENFEDKTPSKIEFESVLLKCGKNVKTYTIKTIHDLTQFIGYGKYMNNSGYNVFLRGQTELYNGALIPSIYRGRTRLDTITTKYSTKINQIKNDIISFNRYDRVVLEPLLQHYGIKTPYIDLVDNIWVALWFALHKATVKPINSHEYVYYYNNDNTYSYILLIATDAINPSKKHGIYNGKTTTLIDLRKALPSYFLRPHAQHAYMLKKNEAFPGDYSDLIIGIAKIPTDLGFKWLGINEFLTVSSLFPAAYFDSGYAKLLKEYPEYNEGTIKQYGSIQIITD